MELLIERSSVRGGRVLGTLAVDGQFQCYTRERPIRLDALFVAGESGLPRGNYNVSLVASRRYQRILPLIASTQSSRNAVRIGMWISPGRFDDADTGDLMVGTEQLGGSVARTRLAFDALFSKLEFAAKRGEAIDLTIL